MMNCRPRGASDATSEREGGSCWVIWMASVAGLTPENALRPVVSS